MPAVGGVDGGRLYCLKIFSFEEKPRRRFRSIEIKFKTWINNVDRTPDVSLARFIIFNQYTFQIWLFWHSAIFRHQNRLLTLIFHSISLKITSSHKYTGKKKSKLFFRQINHFDNEIAVCNFVESLGSSGVHFKHLFWIVDSFFRRIFVFCASGESRG